MRCPDCNKFVSLEMADPEVDADLETVQGDDATGDEPSFRVFGTVRIVRTCGECSNELKEATLDVDLEVAWGEFQSAAGGSLSSSKLDALKFKADDAELEEGSIDPIEEGGGRYAKSYFGAAVTWDINIDGTTVARAFFEDRVAASAMDELV